MNWAFLGQKGGNVYHFACRKVAFVVNLFGGVVALVGLLERLW